MPPPVRVRFNTKARGGRPHKKRKLYRKTKSTPDGSQKTANVVDLGTTETTAISERSPAESIAVELVKMEGVIEDGVAVEIITPKTEAQKEVDRKERLMEEMMAESQTKWNKKRKKKLEAYITKKLKKEERERIFESLTQTQTEVDHLNLQSSATLGSNRALTHAEIRATAEDRAVRKVLARRPRLQHGQSTSEDDMNSSDDQPDCKSAGSDDNYSGWEGIDDSSGFTLSLETVPSTSTAAFPTFGSALRKTSGGEPLTPKVVPKAPRKRIGKLAAWNPSLRSYWANRQLDARATSSEGISSASESDTSDTRTSSGESAVNDASGSEISGASSNSSGHSDEYTLALGQKRKRFGGFKEWAKKQLDISKKKDDDQTPERPTVSDIPTEYYALLPESLRSKANDNLSKQSMGALGESLLLPDTVLARHILTKRTSPTSFQPNTRNFIKIDRGATLQSARLKLPILAEEQVIVETILLHPIVVICGETGSGKTTQVPQFLFEAGFGSTGTDNPGMIGITQPRRVAAMAMASRVAHELCLPAERISFQVRYDATVSAETSIKFMTDGVLLREVASDFLLKKYSIIIIDEAHERSMNTDILIGLLSRILKLREELWQANPEEVKPLRLVIMSATLRVDDFVGNSSLFSVPPPVINVEARQHPVTLHYNRHTTHDYLNDAIKKAVRIHCRLPPGGILVFVTGQDEVHTICRKLTQRFGLDALTAKHEMRSQRFGTKDLQTTLKPWIEYNTDVIESPPALRSRQEAVEPDDVSEEQDAHAIMNELEDGLDSIGDSSNDSTADSDDLGIDADESEVPMHVLPLYSLLPKERQLEVFESPPPGHRLVVVATNVAETSLTIPGITYVIDTGRAKKRVYDNRTGAESFPVRWTSKASAEQRAGRAGRTGPGHCYRLYSSAFFENHFDPHDEPEILRVPIEGLVLQMKAMNIDTVVNFPFPTPPDRLALQRAEKLLSHLGALQRPEVNDAVLAILPKGSSSATFRITTLGKAMSRFPLAPRFSKMLSIGNQHGCLPYLIAAVAALSVGDPFVRQGSVALAAEDGLLTVSQNLPSTEPRMPGREATLTDLRRYNMLGDGQSDVFRLLSVVGAYSYAGGGAMFCQDHALNQKAMEEIQKLRAQLSRIVQTNFQDVDVTLKHELEPPSKTQLHLLRQFVTAGFIDHVAVRKDLVVVDVPFKNPRTSRGTPYRAMDVEDDVFIHPTSVLSDLPPPRWVVYQDLLQTKRLWMKCVTAIDPSWLPKIGPSLCTFSRSVNLPASLRKSGLQGKVVTPHFGPAGWPLPNMNV